MADDSNYDISGQEETVETLVDSQEITSGMSQPSVTTKDSTEKPSEVLDPDMDSDSYSLSEDLDWMTPEEEEEKIMDVIKEVASRCTLANPKKRPTSFEILDLLYSVYAPPKPPFSCSSLCDFLSDDYYDEESTTDTPVDKQKV